MPLRCGGTEEPDTGRSGVPEQTGRHVADTREQPKPQQEIDTLAKYKLPERIESIAAYPVTRVGKVDKAAMRADIAKKLADEEVFVPEPARERSKA